jgi:hypothetical protein
VTARAIIRESGPLRSNCNEEAQAPRNKPLSFVQRNPMQDDPPSISEEDFKDNFLSEEHLEISQDERFALIETLALFESGHLQHLALEESAAIWDRPRHSIPDGFNLRFLYGRGEVGTTADIIGWARHLTGNNKLFEGNLPSNLTALLFRNGKDEGRITVEEAACALRLFLETGAPSGALH